MATDLASPQYAELEITFALQGADDNLFRVGLHLTIPQDDAPPDLLKGEVPCVSFDYLKLATHRKDSVEYGQALGGMLFADPGFLEAFRSACRLLHGRGFGIRLRLHLPATAPKLHLLRWETLRVPKDDYFLTHSERILLSRYLESTETQKSNRPVVAKMTALIVAANAWNSLQHGLAAIDVTGEVRRARKALRNSFRIKTLRKNVAVTMNAIERRLADVHILYLICHGVLRAEHPILCLEDENHLHIEVAGEEFARRFKLLNHRPYLVVLASCDGAGTGEVAGNKALAAIGPLLIDAGVPAVVAMQGKISIKTVDLLMREFLVELSRHGIIDLAMATARRRVQEQPDWWSPVLYMRLRSGQLFKQQDGANAPEQPSGRERQEIEWLVDRLIRNLSHMRSGAVERQFSLFQERHKRNPGLISPLDWQQIDTWNAIASEPEFEDWLRFDQVLNEDPLATGGALLLRPEPLRTNEAYYMMVQRVLGQHRAGLRQRNAGAGRRQALREKQTTALLAWLRRAKEQRSRFTQLLAAYGSAPSQLDVACYAAGNQNRPHVFASRVCHGNPFKFAHATDEEFRDLRGGPMFWPDHPCTDKLKSATRPAIVYGAAGAGKSALAHYLCRVRMIAVTPADQEMCIEFSSLCDEQSLLTEIAHKVSKLLIARIPQLTADEWLRRPLLTFLVHMLGAPHVQSELHKGPDFQSWRRLYAANVTPETKRWAEAYYSPVAREVAALDPVITHPSNRWLSELNHIAQALGMRRCHLLFDNVTKVDWSEHHKTLSQLKACDIGLTLFTSQSDCADEIEAMGFVPYTLAWNGPQLLDATYHRVDTLGRWLRDKCVEIELDDHLGSRGLLQSFFHEHAWEILLQRSGHLPRFIFEVLSCLIENSASGASKITHADVAEAINRLHLNAPGAQQR